MHLHVTADSTSKNSGKLRFKTERIDQGENEKKHQNIETELDKVFPTLFREETIITINLEKVKQAEHTKELEQILFEMPSKSDTTLHDMKGETLFTVDYTPPKTSTVNEVTEDGQATSIGKGAFASLAALLLVLCGGIYTMLLKL
jgi:type VII secretion protein EssA